eukprot:752232-Hanusia_phi.AAC.1
MTVLGFALDPTRGTCRSATGSRKQDPALRSYLSDNSCEPGSHPIVRKLTQCTRIGSSRSLQGCPLTLGH